MPTDEEYEEMREAEECDSSLVPMGDEDFVAPGFKAKVLSVKVVKEYPVIEGAVDKSGEKQLYCYVELEGQKWPWRWRVTNSTQGTQHVIKEAFKVIKIQDMEGEDTGEVGIDLKDIKHLKGNTFYFERRNLQLGSYLKKNFPVPAIYFRPPPKKEGGEDEKKEDTNDGVKEETEDTGGDKETQETEPTEEQDTE